jgi:hypothetical protein
MAPPLLLIDNVFDTMGQYPDAILTPAAQSAGGINQVVGHEAWRVADGRRERSSWMAITSGTAYLTSIRPTNDQIVRDTCFVDRGHNLWGGSVGISSLLGDANSTDTRGVPALDGQGQFTPGGDPTTSVCITEEGALWFRARPLPTSAAWSLVAIPSNPATLPVIPGAMLGQGMPLASYSKTFDEDAGMRTQGDQQSTALWRGTEPTYHARTCQLSFGVIGAVEYDSTMRRLRAQLFAQNLPVMLCLDPAGHPERTWLYQLDQPQWAMAKSGVYRDGTLTFRELGPRLPTVTPRVPVPVL